MALLASNYSVEFVEPLEGEDSPIVCKKVYGLNLRLNTARSVNQYGAIENIAGDIEPVTLTLERGVGKGLQGLYAWFKQIREGNLVWGARTLAGNDNEWRYVNVRRLFNMVKASLQKATGFAVFQPNTPITWLKVRAMMESYLEDLWQAGGLVGETKEQAFFVRVGKGITMNEQDILEGRMKIDVGLRASRPAEFIVINFTHYVQDN